jgi:hypothetical protein
MIRISNVIEDFKSAIQTESITFALKIGDVEITGFYGLVFLSNSFREICNSERALPL